jgi:TonB family protein
MRAYCFTGVIFALLLPVMIAQSSSAQSPDSRQLIDQLAAATSLDRDDQHPWHLRMSFDLYDLEGKKKESGTAEEWWVSRKSYRLVITSPSFNETIPSAKHEPAIADREAYLVHNLLDQVIHPIPRFDVSENLKAEERPHIISKTKLSCLVITPSLANSKNQPAHSGPNSQFCTEPDSNVLRIRFDEGYGLEIIRNRLASFLSTSVALDNAVSYGKLAITGHVDVLEAYDPVKTPVELETSSREPETISGLVIAGRTLSKTVPSYPQYARDQHISGTVVLCAIISKQGTISSLDVVASPDPSLSQSSLEAVKHWTYTPYLLDGVPTEIDTTITVNYALR